MYSIQVFRFCIAVVGDFSTRIDVKQDVLIEFDCHLCDAQRDRTSKDVGENISSEDFWNS